jgi:DNA-directed RNA polymerase specialized sigma24 family protein
MSRTVEGTAAVEALVERARRNDREALAALYDRYHDRIARFAAGCLGDAEKAEDVTSETFEAMLRNLRSYRLGTDFEAWLFTIAHRRVTDHFRRLGRRREVEFDATVEPANATEVLLALDEALPEEAAAERFWPAWATPPLAARGGAARTTLYLGSSVGFDGGDSG